MENTTNSFGRKLFVFALMLAAIFALAFTGCEDPINSPTATLTGITAAYTGTAAVYPETPLDTLKAGLTVTANYSNKPSTTLAAADYTLSGTLTVGDSVITVTYQGKETTFTVNVSARHTAPGCECNGNAENCECGADCDCDPCVEPNNDITYSVTQDGGTDGTADTTGIVFTFSASVDSLSLTAADITVGGNAAKGANAVLSGTGTTRTLSPITVTHAGQATVSIAKTGIAAGTQHVTVYKANEAAPTLKGITAVYTPIAATVYPTTPLDDLKAGLTVTAQYSDDSDEETLSENEYDLSVSGNTLTVGPNTITVTYEGKETTFTVTVTAARADPGCECGGNAEDCDCADCECDPCAAPNNDITYTATRADGEDGVTTTTGITFTFSASVTGLTADHISVTSGNGSLTKGALSGSGTSWTLGVTVITPGNVTVAIDKTGIEAGPKDVTVYKAGQTAPTLTGISAVYTQGSTIIYPTTPLNDLKAGLTVTATYNTGAPQQVTAYSLSGTLSAGTSTITVTFEGKTTTFTVTVTVSEPGTPGLAYELINNGTAYCVRKGSVTGGAVVIPATYSGLPVTEIGSVDDYMGAFSYTSITSITIPASVTSIGNYAFSGCTSLTSVTFVEGSQLKTIGDYAFNHLDSLTSVTIPAGVTSIGFGAFAVCTSLTSVTFATDSQLETIGSYAFADCTSITSITIPVSVTEIGDNAFSYWTYSQTIYVELRSREADGAWSSNWHINCNANIIYGVASEIAITQQPNITEYFIGDQLSIYGLEVTATYSDGTTATAYITAAEITGFDSVTAGDKTLTVTYGGKTATFTVTVMDSIIEITQQPNKTVYRIGEQLDITGLEVTYNLREIVSVNLADITGFDSATAGDKTLTVTYNGKTATFTVTVLGNDILLVTNTTEWNAAITTISTGGNNQSYTVYVRGSISVAGSTYNTFGSVSGLTVTLKGDTLSLSSNGNLLRVGVNQTLIIDNGLTLQESVGWNNNDNSLVYITNNARLELKNGTISGNRNYYVTTSNNMYSRGGGVYVDSGGSFTMSGGTIIGNYAYIETTRNDGNNYAYGGGVYNAGTFTMTGGTISGNRAYANGSYNVSKYAYGGGIYNAGTFRIAAGTVYGTGESDLNNIVMGGGSFSNAQGAALYNAGTAQRGTFSIPGDITSEWNSSGTLSTTNDTISVVNGALQ